MSEIVKRDLSCESDFDPTEIQNARNCSYRILKLNQKISQRHKQ